MRSSDYELAQLHRAEAGYRLVREQIDEYASSPRFAGYWVMDGKSSRVSYGAHGVDAFYFAAAFEIGESIKSPVAFGVTARQFNEANSRWKDKGYLLNYLSPHPDKKQRFIAIWRLAPNASACERELDRRHPVSKPSEPNSAPSIELGRLSFFAPKSPAH